jgi:triphosphoribosyl-dephospho-CoA synthetase
MFALSARHLGQTRAQDQHRKSYNQLADMYNEACINIMKSILTSNNYEPAWTENLFAATIILQVMEEMNGRSPRNLDIIYVRSHKLGMQADNATPQLD